jgi:hypothetical protein
MINKSILIGLTSILMSCAYKDIADHRPGKKHRPEYSLDRLNIDPWIKPATMEFIEELNKRHIEYVIDFEEINVVNEISDNIVGLCTYFKKVDILKRDLLPYELRLIVFHELGHCILKLDHLAADSMQIMQPTVINNEYYLKTNWEALIETLMTSTNKINFEFHNDKKVSYGK